MASSRPRRPRLRRNLRRARPIRPRPIRRKATLPQPPARLRTRRSPTDDANRGQSHSVTKGLTYLALGLAAGVALAGISEGALQAAAVGTDRLALFSEVFNKVR